MCYIRPEKKQRHSYKVESKKKMTPENWLDYDFYTLSWSQLKMYFSSVTPWITATLKSCLEKGASYPITFKVHIFSSHSQAHYISDLYPLENHMVVIDKTRGIWQLAFSKLGKKLPWKINCKPHSAALAQAKCIRSGMKCRDGRITRTCPNYSDCTHSYCVSALTYIHKHAISVPALPDKSCLKTLCFFQAKNMFFFKCVNTYVLVGDFASIKWNNKHQYKNSIKPNWVDPITKTCLKTISWNKICVGTKHNFITPLSFFPLLLRKEFDT